MEDKYQEELAIFDVCVPLKECEGIIASMRSNTNEQNLIISTKKTSEITLQNGLINSTEKEIVIVEKGADQRQSALKPVPEHEPNPSSQIGDAPPPPPPAPAPAAAPTSVVAPAESNRSPKLKRGFRARPRSTRTISLDPSSEPGIQDNRKQRRSRPTITDDDDWLPPAWERRTETRRNGATAGRKDKYYVSPEGHRFRSRVAVENYIYGPRRVLADYHLRTRTS